jgi:hypothetical protein
LKVRIIGVTLATALFAVVATEGKLIGAPVDLPIARQPRM